MIEDGSENELVDDSSQLAGINHQDLSPLQSQSSQRSAAAEKIFMETVGRTFSDSYRNSSEEIFLKTLIEGSIGLAAPTMETQGFKNLSQTFRADSEELFNSWLTNGEINGSIAQRTWQASRKLSSELAALSTQQNGATIQNRRGYSNLSQQNMNILEETSKDNQLPLRNVVEKGVQASNMFLAKAWFQSSHPMTRSRSSELRRRYAAMQIQMSNAVEPMPNTCGGSLNTMDGSSDALIGQVPGQPGTFLSPSNSSSSPFCTSTIPPQDAVSSVVSMLKGTLERKKLNNHVDKEAVEASSFGYYGSQEGGANMNGDQEAENWMPSSLGNFQAASLMQLKDFGNLQTVEECVEIDIENFVAPINPVQMTSISQEPSQSESSAAAPVLSTGVDVCDGPTSSGQTLSVCESSRKQIGNGHAHHGSKAKEFRERIFENNEKDEQKRGSLVQMGSLTSGGSVDKGDPTKKRRVERSRKMAEAKERNMTPAIPSDMQAVLKRCEILEKEVRSLKLNLSFMNRKDSEQTKQIEELQKQNNDLANEKERLLEEIERILSVSGKM
ncbi:protein CYCLOPS-like [Aristolochia californica]|uniref:protein CYCLOPS-like n=1 Tax=Aristolochia californica TaxID=171875 RepID=UPI0035D8A4A6